MKKFILFSLLCLFRFNEIQACGFYPYGEDIRLSFLKPNLVFPYSQDRFFYTWYIYSDMPEISDGHHSNSYDENIQLWAALFEESIDPEDIYQAVYEISSKELKNKKSKNAMVRLLNQPMHKNALNYLLFAKKCSIYNGNMDDPWERASRRTVKKRLKLFLKAKSLAFAEKNSQLKQRYAHLAIRLAYYSDDEASVREIYKTYFEKAETKNAIDYWAWHFKLKMDDSSIERNIAAAVIFLHSPEKRYAVHSIYDRAFDLNEVYKKTSTTEEKKALLFYHSQFSIEQNAKNFDELQKMGLPEEELLRLALREINKMEDWILTPYYTLFEPSLPTSWEDSQNIDLIRSRVKEDRKYALQFSKRLLAITQNKNYTNEWWSTLEVYSRFLADERKNLLADITTLNNLSTSNENLKNFRTKLFTLVRLKTDPTHSLSNPEIQKNILAFKNDNRFLFALGRELEFEGNKSDAACLLSHVNESDEWWDGASFWKTNQFHHSLGSDFYTEYFFYLDAAYSIDDMKNLLSFLDERNEKNDFDGWKTRILRKDYTRFHDLLGMKYFRKNDLENALQQFEQVDDTLWHSDYFPYKQYLSKDPFANNFYNLEDPLEENYKTYTKPALVAEMIDLKNKCDQTLGDDKAYFAFRLANCYRNMSQHGNAWLMRRYWWTGTATRAGFEDDDEYLHCEMAKKYYLTAANNATTKKFAALSLRMAGKCESYKLLDLTPDAQWDPEEYDKLLAKNSCYKKLKKEFASDYEPLISSCYDFYEYYASIGK